MDTIIKTTSGIFLVFLFLTVTHSISIKIFPTIQSWENVVIWKTQVNQFRYEQERKKNSEWKQKFEWKKYKVDNNLKGPTIGKDDWNYPHYIVKHSNGFENTMSDIISPQDTMHIIHNAKCISLLKKEGRVFSDTLSEVNFCKYIVKDNRLILRLYEESISNAEEITIEIAGRKFIIDYETSYVFPYKSIYWKIKEKSLILNQTLPVKIGSELIGELNVEIDETIFYRGSKPSTKRTKVFKGKFQIDIEGINPNYF